MGERTLEEITDNMIIVPIEENNEFTQKFKEHLGIRAGAHNFMDIGVFSNGEFNPVVKGDVKGKTLKVSNNFEGLDKTPIQKT